MAIFEPNSTTFDFNSITLANPQPIANNSFFTKITMGKDKPLYVQLPKCMTKQGIVPTKTGKFCDLMYERDQHEDLMHWIEKMETACQDKIDSNKKLWFQAEFSRDEIESMMTPLIRLYKSGKFALLRTCINTSKHTGQDKCVVYNEDETSVELESVSLENAIIPLIFIEGIKFSARSFELDIKLVQLMVLKSEEQLLLPTTCLIKQRPVMIESSSPAMIESSSPAMIESSSPVMIESSMIESSSLNIMEPSENNSKLPNEGPSLLETLEKKTILTEDFIEAAAAAAAEPPLLEKETMQEIHLEYEKIADSITLRNPKDVYYEIYKIAREKAKQLRKEAMEAYLEAKGIKTKYMLSDSEGSDESDDLDD